MKIRLYHPPEALLRLKGLLSRSTLPATQVFQKTMSARFGELTLLSIPWAFIQKLSPMGWRQLVGIKALQGHS